MAQTIVRNGVIYRVNNDGTATVVGYEDQPAPQAPVAIPLPSSPRDQRREARESANTANDAVRTGIAVRGEGREVANRQFDEKKKLRDEFTNDAAVKRYETIISQYGAALNAGDNTAGDQALINSYAQMLNPTSTVMLGEYQATEQVDPIVQQIQNRLKREFGWDGAGRISEKARTAIKSEMLNIAKSANQSYRQTRLYYDDLARRNGFDPYDVTGRHAGQPYLKKIEQDILQRNRKDNPVGVNLDGVVPGGNGGGPAPRTFAGGERYSTQEDFALAQAVQEVYNRGGSPEDMFAAARARGYEPTLQDVQQWNKATRYRDDPKRGPLPSVEPRKSGVRTSMFGVYPGDAGVTRPGAAAIGAANAYSMGGLDEITGAVNSVFSGRPMADEIAWANLAKQGVSDVQPGGYVSGELLGGITQGAMGARAIANFPKLAAALSTKKGLVGAGAAYGGIQGALEGNDNRIAGAGVGALAGAGGAGLGIGAGSIAERLMRTQGGQAISRGARSAINRVVPERLNVAPSPNVPDMSAAERLLPATDKINGAIGNLRDAASLNLPYALADAAPELRNLAGSATRLSPEGRALGERVLDPRQMGQADRAREGIDSYLAPITDIEQRRAELFKAGNIASEPFYSAMRGQQAPTDRELLALLDTPAGSDALKRAAEIAGNNGRSPTEMGFIIDDSGSVALPGMDGRYVKAKAANPADMLSSGTVRSFNGAIVPNRAPMDLVGWLRVNGGLRDQSGELGHMGLSNAMRPGSALKGRENQFGPIVNNESGMNFDDAALRAWEAGYFPELSDRPDVNTFLNAIREGHDGVSQRFRPEDQGTVENYMAALEDKQNLDRLKSEFGTVWNDTSVPAGPERFDEVVPPEAYGQKEMPLPTFETLDMVKRGFDARLDEARNPVTGTLDLQGNPQLQAIEGLRQKFVSRLDQLNDSYPKARAEYARFAKRADALDQGLKMTSPSLPQRTFDRMLGDASAYDANFRQDMDMLRPEIQRGYATGMADQVGKARLSGNPYEPIYGSPNQQQRVASLFPEGAAKFDRLYNLEKDMTKTAREITGGSPTAPRQAADKSFAGDLSTAVIDAGSQAVTGGGLNLGSLGRGAMRMLGDRAKYGIGKKAEEKASNVAKILLNTNPRAVLDYIEDLGRRQLEDQFRKQTFKKRGGLFGAVSVPVVTSSYLSGQ